tara:strand:- start:1113 stop:1364 length:252 start_codon:yes stop_codon:yes gene_type:complete
MTITHDYTTQAIRAGAIQERHDNDAWNVIFRVDWKRGDGVQSFCRETYPRNLPLIDLEERVTAELISLTRREGGEFSAHIERW